MLDTWEEDGWYSSQRWFPEGEHTVEYLIIYRQYVLHFCLTDASLRGCDIPQRMAHHFLLGYKIKAHAIHLTIEIRLEIQICFNQFTIKITLDKLSFCPCINM